MAAKGYTDFGTVFAILTVQGNVSSMLLNFGSAWGMMQESVAASELIHEVLNTDKKSASRYSPGRRYERPLHSV